MKFAVPAALAAVFALAAVAAPDARAVDVVNADGIVHEIVVEEAGSSTIVEIYAGETLADICDECTVQFESVGEVVAKGPDRVVINANSISVEK